MHRATAHRSVGGALVVLAIALVALAALSGCQSTTGPISEPAGSEVGTGTVQAPLPEPTSTPTTSSVEPTTAPTEAFWPKKVGSFAKSMKYTVWYPKALPKGFAIETLDIVELDSKTGLICDILYLSGEKALFFTQGSPKGRTYDIVSTEKVPWGTATADVTRMDPEDPNSPQVIVYNKDGNWAELSGDLTLDQLKAIAASMMPVK